ncbi:PepSY-associated TM helix domain-containing protein [Nocardia seriolae]|nr:PepSY-associated TM helix domain-containing protein [Nocardia seriolae]MTJ61647.1 PepSY domain-containing protein [Nocardia seriolae]MTJ75170.1 PepSY domain-containing protein [Nocardia seriolae]MTJ86665.1 PepSY domain-containing protein [Nocardia seriolae]MTK30660.1 PepSY domain-containing protein [Nocardia seriolae]MTK39613.1 PepSY domain-containing protein [Nocardia seriolae]
MTITDSGVDSAPPPSPTRETEPPSAGKPPKRSAGNAFQALMLRLHFYAGVFVAPFILIAAVTGALYAISPTLENITSGALLHTDSAGPAKPLKEQIAAAQTVEPKLALVAVAPGQNVGDTTRVIFSDPALGASERRAVFVDPVTATPVGDSVVYGSSGALPMRTWIDKLHRDLHLGDVGRYYSEIAASWLWLVALAGLVLWYRRVRARREKRSAGWLLRPDRSRPRARTLNWHAVVGVWILPVLLLLSVTGMTWSKYAGENVTQLRKTMSWTTPAVSAKLPGTSGPAMSAGGEHDHHGGGAMAAVPAADKAGLVDTVYGVARANGLTGPIEISIPAKDGMAFVVQELRRPGQYTRDAIAVDGATGNVTDKLPYADWPLMAKLTNWGIQFHMGLMFGLANQLLLLAIMVGLGTVIVRGYMMWWRRRPTKERALAVGRAPRRALAQTPLIVLLPLAAAAAVIGWFAPMIGLPLLAFLVIDVLVGVGARLRRSAA